VVYGSSLSQVLFELISRHTFAPEIYPSMALPEIDFVILVSIILEVPPPPQALRSIVEAKTKE
jgi:hypothetical protein